MATGDDRIIPYKLKNPVLISLIKAYTFNLSIGHELSFYGCLNRIDESLYMTTRIIAKGNDSYLIWSTVMNEMNFAGVSAFIDCFVDIYLIMTWGGGGYLRVLIYQSEGEEESSYSKNEIKENMMVTYSSQYIERNRSPQYIEGNRSPQYIDENRLYTLRRVPVARGRLHGIEEAFFLLNDKPLFLRYWLDGEEVGFEQYKKTLLTMVTRNVTTLPPELNRMIVDYAF